MIGEIVRADFGLTALAVIAGVASSAVPAIITAIRQWIKNRNTKFAIKTGSMEISFDLKHLSSQETASIIDKLTDKANGGQAKP
jgi:hypothetical protein